MSGLNLTRLMEIERQGWDSLQRSAGGDFYGRLMLPGAVMILVNGMVMDRDAVVHSLDDSPPWESYELTEERLVQVGADAAALVYRASATRDGQAEAFVALMCSIYREIEGEPRLALYQQTTITH